MSPAFKAPNVSGRKAFERIEVTEGNDIHDFDMCDFRLKFSYSTGFTDEDPSDFVTRIVGRLKFYNDDSEGYGIPAGRLIAHRIEITRAMNQGRTIWDIFDSIDAELSDYWEALFEEDKIRPEIENLLEPSFNGSDLLIIDRVEVLSEFRGHNLGLMMTQRAIECLSSGCQYVAIRPFPLQFSPRADKEKLKRTGYGTFVRTESAAIEKLRRYWATIGFVRIGESNVFLLNPSKNFPNSVESMIKQ